MHPLQSQVEQLYAAGTLSGEATEQARQVFQQFREALTQGRIRAAEKTGGHWQVNVWVKQGILLGFRLGELIESGDGALSFVDKSTFPARHFSARSEERRVGKECRCGWSTDH